MRKPPCFRIDTSSIVNVPLLLECFFEEICLSDDVDGSLVVQNNAPIGIFLVHSIDPFETFFYDWGGQADVAERLEILCALQKENSPDRFYGAVRGTDREKVVEQCLNVWNDSLVGDLLYVFLECDFYHFLFLLRTAEPVQRSVIAAPAPFRNIAVASFDVIAIVNANISIPSFLSVDYFFCHQNHACCHGETENKPKSFH